MRGEVAVVHYQHVGYNHALGKAYGIVLIRWMH